MAVAAVHMVVQLVVVHMAVQLSSFMVISVMTLPAACLQAADAEFPAAEQYEAAEREAGYRYAFAWFDFPLDEPGLEQGGVYACSLDKSYVAVVRLSDDDQASSLTVLDTKTGEVNSQPDWGNIPNDDLMLEEAEAKIRAWCEFRGVGPIDRLVAKDAPWWNAPASDGQINLLMKMYPEEGDWTSITKGQATEKITIKVMARAMGMEGKGGGQGQPPGGLGEPPTAKQLEFIRGLLERTPAGHPEADELRGLGDGLARAVGTKGAAHERIDKLLLVAAPRAQGQGQGQGQASHMAGDEGGPPPPTAKQLEFIRGLLERTPAGHPEADELRGLGDRLAGLVRTKGAARLLIDKLIIDKLLLVSATRAPGQGQGQVQVSSMAKWAAEPPTVK